MLISVRMIAGLKPPLILSMAICPLALVSTVKPTFGQDAADAHQHRRAVVDDQNWLHALASRRGSGVAEDSRSKLKRPEMQQLIRRTAADSQSWRRDNRRGRRSPYQAIGVAWGP